MSFDQLGKEGEMKWSVRTTGVCLAQAAAAQAALLPIIEITDNLFI